MSHLNWINTVYGNTGSLSCKASVNYWLWKWFVGSNKEVFAQDETDIPGDHKSESLKECDIIVGLLASTACILKNLLETRWSVQKHWNQCHHTLFPISTPKYVLNVMLLNSPLQSYTTISLSCLCHWHF